MRSFSTTAYSVCFVLSSSVRGAHDIMVASDYDVICCVLVQRSLVCCSTKKAEMLVKALRKTLSDFSRDRSFKRLSFNEEQIHKFDRSVVIQC